MVNYNGKRIAVLMGGPGSERRVSLKTGEGVAAALRRLGATVTEVDVVGPEFVLPPDTWLAFNVIHGTMGEDGVLQRILEARNVPYTGEGVAGSELAIDKIRTKQRFVECGIPTASFEVIRDGQYPRMAPPYVVKAPREGSTVGIFIVHSEGEAAAAMEAAWRFGGELLVEEFVAGRELTVGVLGDKALPIVEIRPKGGFYDFDNKYPFLNPNAGGSAEHFCPAPLDKDTTAAIQEIALEAHQALGLQTYSRVDFLLGSANRLVALEINTIPGMTPTSLLPEAAAVAGIGYDALCSRIIELSLLRQGIPVP
jgi:D-alanine-D-alanine ligase